VGPSAVKGRRPWNMVLLFMNGKYKASNIEEIKAEGHFFPFALKT